MSNKTNDMTRSHHPTFGHSKYWTDVKDMADIFRVVWSLHTLTLVPPFLYAFGIIIFHEQFHLTYFTYTMGYTCAFLTFLHNEL